MSRHRVAIVSLGREQAMGEVRRVESWQQIFAAAGAEVVAVTVRIGRRPHFDGVTPVARGSSAPERLAWSGPQLRDALRAADPDLVVVVSTRAFDARSTAGPWVVVLDLVDSLARSYADRASLVAGAPKRLMYTALARAHRRVESNLQRTPGRRVAAGWADAHTLNAEWVPNTIDESLVPLSGVKPDVDVLFFGTLRYPPNIDALERLARVWPAVRTRRPSVSAVVAGAAPTPRVVELCRAQRWELVANFASLPTVAARARVAVAPLSCVAGIQNKVIDATSVGLPQVVTPPALEGFAPGIPLVGCPDDDSLVAEILHLLDRPDHGEAQVATLRGYFRSLYQASAWAPWARSLFDHAE